MITLDHHVREKKDGSYHVYYQPAQPGKYPTLPQTSNYYFFLTRCKYVVIAKVSKAGKSDLIQEGTIVVSAPKPHPQFFEIDLTGCTNRRTGETCYAEVIMRDGEQSFLISLPF